MFSFLFKKEQQLETLIYQYLENLTRTQEHFVKAMDTCLDEGLCGEFVFLIEQTHKFESKADEIRDEINLLMYSRALIPESREDIMNLIEQVEIIPRVHQAGREGPDPHLGGELRADDQADRPDDEKPAGHSDADVHDRPQREPL
jgi:hypothetical protein